MKQILVLALILLGTTAQAQQWCTDEYDPEVNILDRTESPDYGRTYTIYCYYTLVTTKKVFYTSIYKVTFTNYTNNKLMPGSVFGKHLREKALEYIKAQYPDVYLGYPNNYPDFCLSLEDIKTNRAESIASQKERHKEAIEVGDVNPGVAKAPSADSNSGQSVKFELVQM